jgi:hypothetical protein
MDNDLKTSVEWQRLCPSPKVIGFEGWNGEDQWQNVEMSYLEYQQRVFLSTCAFISLSPSIRVIPEYGTPGGLVSGTELLTQILERDARTSQIMANTAVMSPPDFLGLLHDVPAPSRTDPQIISSAERKRIREQIERLCGDRE